MEDKSNSDTSCNWCTRNGPQTLEKGAGRVGNQRTNQDHPNYSIVKILRRILETWEDLLSLRPQWKNICLCYCEKFTRSKMIHPFESLSLIFIVKDYMGCCILITIAAYIYIYKYKRNIIKPNDDFNERTNTFFYKNIPLSLDSRKGWCWLCVRGELETGTDCYILTPTSSDHSSTSFVFWLDCSTVGHWGPQALSLQADSHAGILSPTGTGTGTAVCVQVIFLLDAHLLPMGVRICHHLWIQPRPQVKVIFRYLWPDAPVSRFFHLFTQVDWWLGRGSICYRVCEKFCNILMTWGTIEQLKVIFAIVRWRTIQVSKMPTSPDTHW